MIAVEHVAWQVNDPPAVAKWYGENLGFRVLRKLDNSPFTHFMVDAGNRLVVEIYNNPAVGVPDYKSMNPQHLHLAFAAADLEAEQDRLLRAGASIAESMFVTPAGDKLIMLRDPWGFAIQLCKRTRPMM